MDGSQLTFIFDVDGTLCPIKKQEQRYEDLEPYPQMVKKLKMYSQQGAKIVLFTSRNMRTFQGDIEQIKTHTAPKLLKWLEKWDIPYDEVIFGKPWPGTYGFYVDDRAVRPDEFLSGSPEQLAELCRRSAERAITDDFDLEDSK